MQINGKSRICYKHALHVLDMCFRKIKLLSSTTPRVLLMQMDLSIDLELSMGNYLRIFLAEVWS